MASDSWCFVASPTFLVVGHFSPVFSSRKLGGEGATSWQSEYRALFSRTLLEKAWWWGSYVLTIRIIVDDIHWRYPPLGDSLLNLGRAFHASLFWLTSRDVMDYSIDKRLFTLCETRLELCLGKPQRTTPVIGRAWNHAFPGTVCTFVSRESGRITQVQVQCSERA
jgi:hypothetical protein